MLLSLSLLVAGLVLLVFGAEILVKGASHLATAAGVPALIVGLTVVAFGTSAPELAVSVRSTLYGEPDIAVGNVIGSNIFNVLFILGGAALIAPLAISAQLIKVDVPLMVATSILLYLFGRDGLLTRWEGAVLFSGIVAYTLGLLIKGRRETKQLEAEYEAEFGSRPEVERQRIPLNIFLVIGGVALLVFGARLLTNSAVDIARALNVSDLVIALTIVAAGTSLPEVATSFVATYRGERDVAVGNVVGSNVFNILSVLGASAFVSPIGLPVSSDAVLVDIPVMLAVTIACVPVFLTRTSIDRWEGALMLVCYIAYVMYLILDAHADERLPTYQHWMMHAFLPGVLMLLTASLLKDGWRGADASSTPTA
jgi:cation:H+ antiporter